jgi:hypothetical protein
MAHRKSLVQRRFWLRKEQLSKLEDEAEKTDRSLTEVLERRIDASYEIDNLREIYERLMLAIGAGLRTHPAAATSVKDMMDELEITTEKAAQQDFPTARLDDKPKPRKRSRK